MSSHSYDVSFFEDRITTIETIARSSMDALQLANRLTEAGITSRRIGWSDEEGRQGYYAKLYEAQANKDLLQVVPESGNVIFQPRTIFRTGLETWCEVVAGSHAHSSLEEIQTTAAALVAQSRTADELVTALLEADFPYFNLSWDESDETQADAEAMKGLFTSRTFRNANEKWVMVGTDRHSQF